MPKVLILALIYIFYSCASTENKKSILDKIIDTKKIVVATTGDYPPFTTFHKDRNKFNGLDIDLAKNLAKSLHAEVVFYKTSWSSLIDDLKNNKFDIAMSGISENLERQKVGLFSDYYLENGKMAISRCSDVDFYNTLKKIDRKNVRLIVNIGGTNQRFVKENIKHAKVLEFEDNRSIFKEIIDKRADVMITDSVEVYYQSRKNLNKLCPSMKRPLTRGRISFLLPRDIIWKEYVDTWLSHFKKGDKGKLFFDKVGSSF